MEVLISNRQKKIKLNLRRIRTLAEEILRFEGLPENTELSLVFCDDDFIQKLNDEYLGKNRPTDVLSFPIDEDEVDHEVRLLGDVVISMETAERQAKEVKHAVGLEVAFLMIHGLLHLMGYDHQKSKGDLLRMREREQSICGHLGEKNLLKGIERQSAPSLIERTIKPKKPAKN
jgi:probable rRNA maturation factor